MSIKKTQSKRILGRPVLVTTDKRGVFFGYLIGELDREVSVAKLANCRMVVSWDAATRGVVGLAANGPTDGCRVTAAAGNESALNGVTGVFGVTEAARLRFEAGPWAR
jgi:hypothetical protein